MEMLQIHSQRDLWMDAMAPMGNHMRIENILTLIEGNSMLLEWKWKEGIIEMEIQMNELLIT